MGRTLFLCCPGADYFFILEVGFTYFQIWHNLL